MESDRPRLRSLAELIYRYVFLGYTTSSGVPAEDLDRAVSGRVPVIVGPRTEYFDDTYQGIPSEAIPPWWLACSTTPTSR